MENETIVLTPSALMAFLSEIEELKGTEIALQENADSIEIQIGEGSYKLESASDTEIEVTDEVVDEIEELNQNGYEALEDVEVEPVSIEGDGDIIEGGIIKELIKTLAVGGLVRLTKNAIANS